MIEISQPFLGLITAVLIGYLLGSLPVAARVSRRQGVDIFSAGTQLAGASNVRKNVGNRSGAFVLSADIAKGMFAMFSARALGVEGDWVLLPAAATVLGHWNSVFTGFRGGDGMGPLGGITLVLFPVAGFVGVAAAMAVALGGQRMPYTSLLSIVVGYVTIGALNYAFFGDISLTLGVSALGLLVLAHASLGHRRRRRADEWSLIDEPD